MQAAGLLFFAFAGYARIATLGEEVREPERTIPRAILIALGITVGVYAAVGLAALTTLGPASLAATSTPLAATVDAVGAAWAEPIVRLGAAIASAGALLALVAGVGRTAFAMAREGDLPRTFAVVDPRYSVPHHAELAVGAAVVLLVLVTDLRGAIGFSSFGVLMYYAIANAAAFTQRGPERRAPRTLNIVGGIACVSLMVTLPVEAVAVGVAVLAVGLAGRLLGLRYGRRPAPTG
jgi:APA family basic amino acid/polyamine antiporter